MGMGSFAGLNPIPTPALPLKGREFALKLVPLIPRVTSLSYSAPVYDHLTKPLHAPTISVCIASAALCQCYSQQATKISVSDDFCRSVVRDGLFQEFDDVKKSQSQPLMAQVN